MGRPHRRSWSVTTCLATKRFEHILRRRRQGITRCRRLTGVGLPRFCKLLNAFGEQQGADSEVNTLVQRFPRTHRLPTLAMPCACSTARGSTTLVIGQFIIRK